MILVARTLQRLDVDPIVFVGGAIVTLLLADPGALAPRATRDVDVVVDVATYAAFARFETQLRTAGHNPDRDGPTGRWLIDGVPVDVTPVDASVLGFTNRWYRPLVDTAQRIEVAEGLWIRVASPPMFLAAKLEAHADRGRGDPYMSRDLTDVITLVDGRPNLGDDIGRLPESIREFIQASLEDLVKRSDLLTLVQAHLPPDDASQARADEILRRLRRYSGA
ncbi:MAG: nucleotidyl transferase AbiEii/AbiGii toxin family protein [Trueperaceae bacterium]